MIRLSCLPLWWICHWYVDTCSGVITKLWKPRLAGRFIENSTRTLVVIYLIFCNKVCFYIWYPWLFTRNKFFWAKFSGTCLSSYCNHWWYASTLCSVMLSCLV